MRIAPCECVMSADEAVAWSVAFGIAIFSVVIAVAFVVWLISEWRS